MAPPRYSFEPLGDQNHKSFSCGVASLDDYLHSRASQDAKRKVAAPFVMADSDGVVVGYYTLSSYGIRVTELPEDLARKLPRYPLIPATLLGRLAVSRERQGQRLGSFLLMDALYRSWRTTTQIASIGVVAEAIDASAERFYLHHEFVSLTAEPRKLFLGMKTIGKLFAAL